MAGRLSFSILLLTRWKRAIILIGWPGGPAAKTEVTKMAVFHLNRHIRKFLGHGVEGREIRVMGPEGYAPNTVWSRRGPGGESWTWHKIGTVAEVVEKMAAAGYKH